jgi:nucleotide sugar dehydrogenase
MDGFAAAIRTLGERLPPGALVLVETTVPPGTCEKVVVPTLAETAVRRGLPADALLVAHSYERVMPGRDYLDSIVNYWRVYAGHTPEAAEACEAFLRRVINVRDYPLTRLSRTVASETAKVMENTYRAVNIAFIDEWRRYAEAVGIDLFEVVGAIAKRPTHANIRWPGFGVGGYCLTKDPTFAPAAVPQLFGLAPIAFPFSALAVKVNHDMPLGAVDRLEAMLGGTLAGRRILLMGISYRQDVDDTRYSPAETFVRAVEARGGCVVCHDPYVRFWEELSREVSAALPPPGDVDALVLAVPHRQFRDLDIGAWAGEARPFVLDANNVLSADRRRALREAGLRVESLGRADGL